MAKLLRCRDTIDGLKECEFVAYAETEEAILDKVDEHVRKSHKKELSKEALKKARSAIKEKR